MKKRRRGRSWDATDQAHNRAVARRRHGVERVWGTLKRWYGASRARYRSTAKNHLHLQLLAAAYNLKRALVLIARRQPTRRFTPGNPPQRASHPP